MNYYLIICKKINIGPMGIEPIPMPYKDIILTTKL